MSRINVIVLIFCIGLWVGEFLGAACNKLFSAMGSLKLRTDQPSIFRRAETEDSSHHDEPDTIASGQGEPSSPATSGVISQF